MMNEFEAFHWQLTDSDTTPDVLEGGIEVIRSRLADMDDGEIPAHRSDGETRGSILRTVGRMLLASQSGEQIENARAGAQYLERALALVPPTLAPRLQLELGRAFMVQTDQDTLGPIEKAVSYLKAAEDSAGLLRPDERWDVEFLLANALGEIAVGTPFPEERAERRKEQLADYPNPHIRPRPSRRTVESHVESLEQIPAVRFGLCLYPTSAALLGVRPSARLKGQPFAVSMAKVKGTLELVYFTFDILEQH